MTISGVTDLLEAVLFAVSIPRAFLQQKCHMSLFAVGELIFTNPH